jgi:hypothetical protein
MNLKRFFSDLEDKCSQVLFGPPPKFVDPDPSKWVRYWFVETRNSRYGEVGDIRCITEQGHLKSVKRLAFGLVEITFDNNDIHTIYDGFATKEEAERYASQVLKKEIERLMRKCDQLAGNLYEE